VSDDQVLRRPFSRSPLPFTLGGRLYEVPYRSAADWLEVLEVTPVDGLFLAALDSEQRWRVQDAMLDGEVRVRDLSPASYSLLAQITGYGRWWIGYRLAVAAFSPTLLGQLTLAGVRPQDVTLVQWCAATYAILTRHASAEDRFKLDAQLDVPLAGNDPGEAWDDMGMSAEDLEAMARELPGTR
jgi:hypothetical protein